MDKKYKGSEFKEVGNITLGVISPEARDLLDEIMKEWENHLAYVKKNNADYNPTLKGGNMKIFAVTNGCDNDFDLEEDFVTKGSNAHSGGIVIIAESLEEAQEIMKKKITEDPGYTPTEPTGGTLKEVPLKKGIVIYARGGC